jgi:succinate-semialdehyde dehydrogenase/glutarate-semialdehyde dehydrogenase
MNPRPLYLNGNWLTTPASVNIVNPATGNAFASVCVVDRARVARAIADAHAAFLDWRGVPGRERAGLLSRVADELEHRAENVARTITLENGKPLPQSRAEVALAVEHLRWFAGEAQRAYGRIVPNVVEGKRHMVLKSPVGVVAAISPWNFPLMLAVRKVAPALAAGCTCILKPASATPLCAIAFAECAEAAKLPPGVFQLVVGPAAELGAEFLENPLCRKITFTGSTAVGRELVRGAAAHVKPLSLELGGCAPVLVFEDCDFKTAVEGTLAAKFRNTGQSCIAANRVYVQRAVYPKFVEILAERTRALKIGNGLEPEAQIGPLINEAAVQEALACVSDAVARGAKLLCGGQRVAAPGFFFAPAVLADVPPASRCMREETFAPIVPVSDFDTEEEAVQLANASSYGLSAYVFTRDLARTFRLAEALEAGTIGINDGVPTTSQCPFGGLKHSGWGRELGCEGLDAFLETKHVSIGLG